MCIDIRGAIRNRSLKGFTRDDGTPATQQEVLSYLMDELAKGHRVIPMDGPCEGFDYQTGCPGHESPAVEHAGEFDPVGGDVEVREGRG